VIIRIIKFHHRGCFILTKNWYKHIYKDGLVGLMDKNGKILVPSKFETIGKENSEKYGFTLSNKINNLWTMIPKGIACCVPL
jgi:hypothetical protein